MEEGVEKMKVGKGKVVVGEGREMGEEVMEKGWKGEVEW